MMGSGVAAKAYKRLNSHSVISALMKRINYDQFDLSHRWLEFRGATFPLLYSKNISITVTCVIIMSMLHNIYHALPPPRHKKTKWQKRGRKW